ncbi:MAG: hypothetical protein IAF94_25120 [Pirellulaceae bacterium]|nr:hypothetical protein [Pirellulaceae bacterium]
MRKLIKTIILCSLLAGLFPIAVSAADVTYEGTWNTTNRKLDGPMTCVVTSLGEDKWQGRFYGVWFGQAFDYTVTFSGSPTELAGKAVIDGADYTWKGKIQKDSTGIFTGTFGGSRYEGYFSLKEKSVSKPSRK